MELKPLMEAHALEAEDLLIVPYGIETVKHDKYEFCAFSFNRTLWN